MTLAQFSIYGEFKRKSIDVGLGIQFNIVNLSAVSVVSPRPSMRLLSLQTITVDADN